MDLPAWADAILLSLLGICLGAIGFFLRQVYKRVDDAVESRDAIRTAVSDLHLALEKALRDTRGTIYEKLDAIRDGLNLINNRVGKLETWKVEHEKNDDTRHEAENGRLDDHHQRIGQLERRQWRRERE